MTKDEHTKTCGRPGEHDALTRSQQHQEKTGGFKLEKIEVRVSVVGPSGPTEPTSVGMFDQQV